MKAKNLPITYWSNKKQQKKRKKKKRIKQSFISWVKFNPNLCSIQTPTHKSKLSWSHLNSIRIEPIVHNKSTENAEFQFMDKIQTKFQTLNSKLGNHT